MLLVIFLFNVGGYYIVFWGVRLQLDQKLTSRIDAELYDHSETVELKIPMALPYPIHADGFQRVNGRFEHNGEFYRLIKHKHENDTLYVVCFRDRDTRVLFGTLQHYVNDTLGLAATNHKAVNYLSKLIKDFFPQDRLSYSHEDGLVVVNNFFHKPELFSSLAIPVDGPPPRI